MPRPRLTAFAAIDAGSGDGACPRSGDRGDPLRPVPGGNETDRRAVDAGAAAGLARRRPPRRLHRCRAGMVVASLRGVFCEGTGLPAASPVISRPIQRARYMTPGVAGRSLLGVSRALLVFRSTV